MAKKKKKRKHPVNLYCVEFEHTVYGETFVRAESENHAKQLVQDNEAESPDYVVAKQIDEEELPDGEAVLNKDGNYE